MLWDRLETDFPLKEQRKPFLIGGGIGIPPMLELGKAVKLRKSDQSLGYRNERYVSD